MLSNAMSRLSELSLAAQTAYAELAEQARLSKNSVARTTARQSRDESTPLQIWIFFQAPSANFQPMMLHSSRM